MIFDNSRQTQVLVFNCGSSSLKYRLIEMPSERQLAGGEAQRVGPPTAKASSIFHTVNGQTTEHVTRMPDHATAFDEVIRLLAMEENFQPAVFGHRIVHGGDVFAQHALVDSHVLETLQHINPLAPIHNPPQIALVKICLDRYPDKPQVLVFDTAYHQTIPDYARTYALPLALREELGLHKYGFHGTSHNYVAEEAAKMLKLPLCELDAVSCHLGSGGASLCAIESGKSIDNTMGYSPLQGLLMSTRCGDLDASLALDLMASAGDNVNALEDVLNRRSGVLGMSNDSADIRDILSPDELKPSDDTACKRNTLELYKWRIRKYLGAYLTVVSNAKAVIFTDTIGETCPEIRLAACSNMHDFGLCIDPLANSSPGQLPADVATVDSPIRICVIQTNEELAIARHSCAALSRG